MAYVINGVLDAGEWKMAARLNSAGNSPSGYNIYGAVDGDAFVFALQSAVDIGFNTTLWLNTDHNTATGHPIFDWLNAGADFNITFVAGSTGAAAPHLYTGASPLHTEAAAQAYAAAIADFAFSTDLNTVEFRVPFSVLGISTAPAVTDVYADINNSVFLPQDYTLPTYKVVDPATLPARTDAGLKVGIVYSETSAAKFFDQTAYSQLFMAAQNQAAMAGVPFDILTEDDLADLAKLVNYDTLIFPSFANVPAAKLGAIQDTLTTATYQYGVGLVAAGNFMTNDETGAALPGDSYARMKTLLGVQLEGWTGANAAVHVAARDVAHPVMEGYAAGETIRDYAAIGSQWFTAIAANATVLVDQVISGQAHNAVLATEVGGRNVHFATEGLLADNNMLAHALDWTARDPAEPALKLHMSRQSSLFAARNDLDEAMQLELVRPEDGGPGIYDKLLPILDQWKAAYNFVGSYYIDIGDGTDGTGTDWAYSKAYYDRLLAAGNEIGSHSMTHPENTNLLTDAQLQYQFQQSKQVIEQNLGITVLGAAIPGAPEKMAVSEKVLQYYSYLSGGNAMVGAGYPGAFGYFTPDQTKVYLAPNISSDFTLIGFKGMTTDQAAAAWQQEWKEMTAHAELPVIVFPWHDYGLAGIEPGYNERMFTSLIETAYQAGSEFVTLADLAQRIAAFAKSGLTYSMVDADTVSATVGSAGLLGTFALDLDGGQKIKSVAGWYAYDDDSVFLPSTGGTFTIDLGPAQDDVTHISALPSRAELLSATSPGGGGLDFSVKGEGKLVIDLANPNGRAVSVTGAAVTSLVGDRLELSLTGLGQHDVSIRLEAPSSYTAAATKATALEGAAGADGTLVFTVTRAGATNTAETVSYALGGTATAGTDYTATPAGSVTFGVGETSKTVVVAATADMLAEGAETVLLTLTGASAGGQLGTTPASGAIQDAKMVPVTTVSATTTASTISGTAAAGSAVRVFDGGTLIGTATASSTGAWSVQAARLSDTVHTLWATTNTAAAAGDTTGVTYYGSSLAEALTGGTVNELLLGNAGNDTLNGGAGADTLAGGLGDDQYTVDAGDVVVESAGGGTDEVRSAVSWTLGANLERLVLSGAAAIDGTGNGDANYILGNAATNALTGGGGNDTLNGGAGADTLAGGAGADRLTGGAGADCFRFNLASDGIDTVTDFDPSADFVQASASGFGGGLVAGMNLAATGRFIANTSGVANSAAGTGQFVYETDVGRLWWDADGAGAGARVSIATFTGLPALTAADVIVIA